MAVTPIAAQARRTSPQQASELRSAVECMDAIAHGGLIEIQSVANLAAACLESADFVDRLDDIANALSSIAGKAEHLQGLIHDQASQVECGYTHPAMERRVMAWGNALSAIFAKE